MQKSAKRRWRLWGMALTVGFCAPATQAATVSGTVVNSAGAAVSGVRVTALRILPFGQQTAASDTTDASGAYDLTGLTDGASYRLTAAKSGVTFNPSAINLTPTGAVAGQDFTLRLGFSGVILSESGAPLPDVVVTRDGAGSPLTVKTNYLGRYSFANLNAGSYTVTPSLNGYSFAPATRTVDVSDAAVAGLDFTASLTGPVISGTVSAANDGSPARSILVRVLNSSTNSVLGSATTNVLGGYQIAVPTSGTVNVKALQSNTTFTPAQYSNIVLTGSSVTGLDFTTTFRVTDTVTNAAGQPVANQPVWLVQNLTQLLPGAPQALTAANGTYSFADVAPGKYYVAPVPAAGIYYTPSTKIVTVSPSNPVANFRAAATLDTAPPSSLCTITPNSSSGGVLRTLSGTVSDAGSGGNPPSGVSVVYVLFFKQNGPGEANAQFYNWTTAQFETTGTVYNRNVHEKQQILQTDVTTGSLKFSQRLPRPLAPGLYYVRVTTFDNAFNRHFNESSLIVSAP